MEVVNNTKESLSDCANVSVNEDAECLIKPFSECEEKEDEDRLIKPFSECEEIVAKLVADGWSEKEIASMLNKSLHTVKNHIRNIKKRNNISKNTELSLLYIAYVNKKKFSIEDIRKYGVNIILVMLNICPMIE